MDEDAEVAWSGGAGCDSTEAVEEEGVACVDGVVKEGEEAWNKGVKVEVRACGEIREEETEEVTAAAWE